MLHTAARRASGLLLAGALLAAGLALPTVPDALAQARSSGGYSRPGGGGFSRTPSTGGTRVAPRTPSFGGGGYSRPQSRSPSTGFPGYGSSGDRAYSREGSGDALARYRRGLEEARRPAPAPVPIPAPGGSPSNSTGGWGVPVPRRQPPLGDPGYGGGFGGGWQSDWYRNRGWSPGGLGGSILGGQRSFGVWDGLFLYYLLDNLSRPGSSDFFRNHRDDPGVREFREQADRLARDNADLRAKLEQLDRQVAGQANAPRDPNYLPPDAPPEIAVAPRAETRTPSTGGSGVGWIAPVAILGGGAALFVLWRRRSAAAKGQGMASSGGLATAGAILRRKLDDTPYVAADYRVGMTVTLDPTPFILAADSTKVPVPVPDGAADSLRVSVPEIGRFAGDAAALLRLYLPDGRNLFQLHLNAQGGADECRYFGLIDEITPADDAEWAVWLDPNEGMIGWPQFQTRDGKIYERLWSPGGSRVAPRDLVETIEGVGGTRQRRSGAMLYAAPTGAAEPAPQTEYILVAAVEEAGQAWIEVRAGIDINPTALLPAAGVSGTAV